MSLTFDTSFPTSEMQITVCKVDVITHSIGEQEFDHSARYIVRHLQCICMARSLRVHWS